MTRLQRLLKTADAMRSLIEDETDGVQWDHTHFLAWKDASAATEFLDALKAFDDVERETEK